MGSDPMEREVIEMTRQARQLVSRLERLSADSSWARRASGCRGALLKILEESGALEGDVTNLNSNLDVERLSILMRNGYDMLERAARQIPDTSR
jgi:hypothetical protein